MLAIDEVRSRLSAGNFYFSQHAFKRAVERNISDLEICQASREAVIIEDYPDDKYSPSCLILGFTENSRPLHIQVSRVNQPDLRIVTRYKPDENEWSNGYTLGRK